MRELETVIGYSFKDHGKLVRAMFAGIDPKASGKSKYRNSPLATLGDAVLATCLTDFMQRNRCGSDLMTTVRIMSVCNGVLRHVTQSGFQRDIYDYAFNETGFRDDGVQVPTSRDHTPYLEAIVGAVFRDRGYERCYQWVRDVLMPKLFRAAAELKPETPSNVENPDAAESLRSEALEYVSRRAERPSRKLPSVVWLLGLFSLAFFLAGTFLSIPATGSGGIR